MFHGVLPLCSGAIPVFGSPGTVVGLLGPKVEVDRQAEPVKALLSRVTAPVCASARPFKLAPVCMAIDVEAKTFPISDVLVPRTAELTSRHHTLQGLPPTTLAVPEVVRVEADLKIQTPDPLRVSVPDNSKAPAQ